MRAIVGNTHASDLVKRTFRLNGVPHQFRGIPVDLVEIDPIWCHPGITRAAADESIERPERPISRNLRASGIPRDGELGAVDAVAAEVAITEVGSEHESVVRGD